MFSSSTHHFCFSLPKTEDCAESRVLGVTDVRVSHVLIGNPLRSHSKYDKLFFWSTWADLLFLVAVFQK